GEHDAAVLREDGVPGGLVAVGDRPPDQLEAVRVAERLAAQELRGLLATRADDLGQRDRPKPHRSYPRLLRYPTGDRRAAPPAPAGRDADSAVKDAESRAARPIPRAGALAPAARRFPARTGLSALVRGATRSRGPRDDDEASPHPLPDRATTVGAF